MTPGGSVGTRSPVSGILGDVGGRPATVWYRVTRVADGCVLAQAAVMAPSFLAVTCEYVCGVARSALAQGYATHVERWDPQTRQWGAIGDEGDAR